MKTIFLILTILIGINFTSFAQNKITPDNGIVQAKLLKSYPNPASTVVNFEFQKGYSRSYSIQILNIIGKKVYQLKNMPSKLSIDIKAEKFYRGIYIYQLLDRNGLVTESGKIFIVS